MQPYTFSQRLQNCIEYFEHRETMRNTTYSLFGKIDPFNAWILRILISTISLAAIWVGASESGAKGLFHAISIIASLFWLFYFIPRDLALRPQKIRHCLSFVMAIVRFSTNEFIIFKSCLPTTTYAYRNRPILVLFAFCGVFLLASNKMNFVIIAILIFALVVFIDLYVSIMKPVFSSYRSGQTSAASVKIILSLFAMQEFANIAMAVMSLVAIKLIFLALSNDYVAAMQLDLDGCFEYFLIAANIYIIYHTVPVLVFFFAPAILLKKEKCGFFYLSITLVSVLLSTIGISGISIFIFALAAVVLSNVFAFFSRDLLIVRAITIVKSIILLILCLAVSAIGLFVFDLGLVKLNVSHTFVITFCILLAGTVWIDSIVFGLIGSDVA